MDRRHIRDRVLEAIQELEENGRSYVTARHVERVGGVEVRTAGHVLRELEDEEILEAWGTSSPQTYRIVSIEDIPSV